MKGTVTHVYGIDPDELTQRILSGFDQKIQSLESQILGKNRKSYVSRKEASELLGVTFATLHSWNKTGILKSRKIGNRVFYSLDEIDRILETSIK